LLLLRGIDLEKHFEKVSPVTLMKACKNAKEIAGMKNCHLRDGVAVVEFLSWLEEYLSERDGQTTISEYDIDLRLTAERAKDPLFLEPSFATIAGVNENGAIIHYR
jgi:Xaa-Pro aminopeptidase